MKHRQIFIIALSIFCFPLIAAAEQTTEKTLSPYFFVKSEDENSDRLPLKDTAVQVDIAGVIAVVRVTQIYKNEGSAPLEATYVFPGSTRAAIYGMKMTIGERVRVAKIKEKQQARKEYKAAKRAGKSASLLEQHRPNVFQMNVANIMPQDEIIVELAYTELLVPTDGVYEFVYPTVVGPRYSNQAEASAPASDKWVANPYLKEGEDAPYAFQMQVSVATGIPIQDLVSTSHDVRIHYYDESSANAELSASEQFGGNRDFILKYRLEGEKIESGLLLAEGKDENFFLMMTQPPKRVSTGNIPPREYIYIVDVSGSMHGFPLNTAKKLLRDLIGKLQPTDRFNVLLFAGSSSLLSEFSLQATSDNINQAIWLLERQRGGGGTELLPALQRALALPRDEAYSRSIVVVTDGYINIETDSFELIRNNLGNANLFAFGIGSSVNRYLIEGMARVGYGEPFVVTKPDEAPMIANKFREYIETPVLTNIELDFGDFDVYDVEPPSVPDLFAERPIVVFGKWRGQKAGTITLRGSQGPAYYNHVVNVANVKPSKINSGLRYLWARHKIASLGDYNKLRHDHERVKQITNLGLTYNLLTQYTSFIAVDDIIRNPGGKQNSTKQALPLPQGVSNLAIGGSVPTVPEPETYALLGILSFFLLWYFIKGREECGAINFSS